MDPDADGPSYCIDNSSDTTSGDVNAKLETEFNTTLMAPKQRVSVLKFLIFIRIILK